MSRFIENSFNRSVESNDSSTSIENSTYDTSLDSSVPNNSDINQIIENISNSINDTAYLLNENLTDNKPEFDIRLDLPSKITRGETFTFTYHVTNIGSLAAKNVVLSFILPNGFEIIPSNSQSCGNLDSNGVCSSELTIETSKSTELGINDIKVVVNYEG